MAVVIRDLNKTVWHLLNTISRGVMMVIVGDSIEIISSRKIIPATGTGMISRTASRRITVSAEMIINLRHSGSKVTSSSHPIVSPNTTDGANRDRTHRIMNSAVPVRDQASHMLQRLRDHQRLHLIQDKAAAAGSKTEIKPG